MIKLKRVIKISLIFLCSIILGVYIFLSYGHTVPRTGAFQLEGLHEPVEVLTDKYGIPHINAKNDHDMMMALGYIMASDRLWQMDILRRIGSGRLSEILGPKLLDTDIFLRKVRLRSQMVENWNKFKKTAPAHMLMEIEAYFKGVNFYVKNGPRPLEMKLLGYTPDEFSIEDSLAVAGYMSLSFAEGFFVDILYSDLKNELLSEDLATLFPRAEYDKNLPDVSIKHISKNDLKPSKKVSKVQDKEFISELKPSSEFYANLTNIVKGLQERFGMFQGSNSWVMSGYRTESGHPILANDPHISYASPSVFYEAHIKSPNYENYGHYIPLIPFPGLGHNKDRAWAITMSNTDDLDYYQETFHPTEPKVLYRNEYVPYKVVKEEIKVRGQDKSHFEEVVITPHGPIIDGSRFVEKNRSLSIKWQFLNETNNPAYTFYLLSKSKELSDLALALSHTSAPGFNISFADSKGNIGWHVMGKVPILNRPGNGRTILDGQSGQDEYLGYLDIHDNPHIYNPENGVIVSANYKPQTQGPISWVGLWQPKDRYARLQALLEQKEKWNIEDLKTVQTDEHVTYHKFFVEQFLMAVEPKTELEKKVLDKLKAWDGLSSRKNVEPSIYYTLMHTLLKNILMDDLGEERFNTYAGGSDAFPFLFQILNRKDSKLWDDVITTDKKETPKEIINQTFYASVTFLKKRLGSNPNRWHWDRLNRVEFKHVLGRVFPLNKIFDLGPYRVAGGSNQVNAMGSSKSDLSFKVFYGPATRRLVDFSNPQKSFGVLPTGNSGHRFSKNYSDQVKLLVNNKYREQNMNFNDLEGPYKTLTLNP